MPAGQRGLQTLLKSGHLSALEPQHRTIMAGAARIAFFSLPNIRSPGAVPMVLQVSKAAQAVGAVGFALQSTPRAANGVSERE